MRELRWASAVAVLMGTTLVGAAQQVGTQPSTTGLTASPLTATAGSRITASATVNPVLTVPITQPGAFPKPGGNVSFFDGTTQVGSPVSVTAGTGFTGTTFQQTFGAPDPTLSTLASVQELTADINGDGIADLLLYATVGNGTQTEVQAFLSKSGGGYTTLPPQTLNTNGTPAVIDENGDGVADLLIGSSISFGNGDGTFQQPAPLPFLSNSYASTYVADVNGDGQPDIVAVTVPPLPIGQTPGPVTFVATVFTNAGGGAFNSLGSVPLATSNACPCALLSVASLNFVDLNGDGFQDMVAQTIAVPAGNAEAAPILTVLLNNGNGTYAAASQVTYPFVFDQGALEPTNLLVGDFNEDGKTDLLLVLPSELGLGHGPEYQTPITFLPGNGDGSFGTPIVSSLSVPVPGSGSPIPPVPGGIGVVGDANLDGHLDIVFGSGAVAQGDGTGAFSLGTPLPLVLPPASTPGGLPSPVPVLLTHPSQQILPAFVFFNLGPPAGPPPQAVFTPNVSSAATLTLGQLAIGTHIIVAKYSGDAVYAASTSPQVTVTIGQAATTTSITSSANPAYQNQRVTYSVAVTSATSVPTGIVTFTLGSTTLGTITLNSGTPAAFLSSTSVVGSETITATYSGDANNLPSTATLNEVVIPAFTILAGTGSSSTITVNSGQTAVAAINVAGASAFAGDVTLACSGLPAHASCIFNPGSLSLTGGQAQATLLTISTSDTVSTASLTAPDLPGRRGPAGTTVAYSLAFGGLLLLGPGVCTRRGKLLCFALAFTILTIVAVGCGGNSKSTGTSGSGSGTGSGSGSGGGAPSTITAKGSYPFTITATAGSAQASANYTLVVQ
jgi:hypothetical protein